MSVEFPPGENITVNTTSQVVTVNETTQVVTVSEVSQAVSVAAAGPQGIPGPTGPAGEVQLYESSSPPEGAARGDLWLVTTPLEQP